MTKMNNTRLSDKFEENYTSSMLFRGIERSISDSFVRMITEQLDSSDVDFEEYYPDVVYKKSETTFEFASVASDSCKKETRLLTPFEHILNMETVAEEKKKYNQTIDRLSAKLESYLALYPYETELLSESEDFIIEIEHKYKFHILGDVVQTVYSRNYDKSHYMVGICKALLRYDLDEVRPWGVVLLSGLINHPDETVKEYVVQLIDNWNDKELLPILRTIEVSSEWLRDYINEVVNSLGDNKCII